MAADSMSTGSGARCLLVSYNGVVGDPPAIQAARALAAEGFRVTILQTRFSEVAPHAASERVRLLEVKPPRTPRLLGPVDSWRKWRRFRQALRTTLESEAPDLVVAIMLHPIAALPHRLRSRLVACVYDIPVSKPPGRLDRVLVGKAWRRLESADLVWSSDRYKARLAEDRARLSRPPLVCHNCPPSDYLRDPLWPRDGWLRSELRRQGARIPETGGCVLLRAGAVGVGGGIEATLAAMRRLPDDHVFLAMGRPPASYREHLRGVIGSMGLQRRAFLWDRPTDDVWKRALAGADAGHLVHGDFPIGYLDELFELNSSLSNNRLFQYMAAALPIISYDDPRLAQLHSEVGCFRVSRLAQLEMDIGAAWGDLGADESLRRRLGERARRAHLERYCWEQQFAPVLAAIRSLPPRER